MSAGCSAGEALRALSIESRVEVYQSIRQHGAPVTVESTGLQCHEKALRRHMRGQCKCPDAHEHRAEAGLLKMETSATADTGESKPRVFAPVESKFKAQMNPAEGTGELSIQGADDPDGLVLEAMDRAGLDPEHWVATPFSVSAWEQSFRDADGEMETRVLHSVKVKVERRVFSGLEMDGALEAARAVVTDAHTPKPGASSEWFVYALGDLQLGKIDGDGLEGTLKRIYGLTAEVAERFRRIKAEQGISRVAILWLGDCIEGHVSQGGMNSTRTKGSTTDQVMLFYRVMLDTIKAFVEDASEVVVAGVPGNHDEATRSANFNHNDSWVTASIGMAEASVEALGQWEQVRWIAPSREEMGIVLDLDGTRLGMIHGHQLPSGQQAWWKWYQGQAAGRQVLGDLDLLIAGHRHHHEVDRRATVEFIQTPAVESESTWWRHKTGEGGRPGVLSMVVGGGKRRSMEIHEP